ncbi:mRNA 3' end processing factor [Marasmius crinis-equi]|uniref:mRNA 3' end processing factor n=1 Tax=Marasmius crinis-equi TaxID=585013 RepID=A0ABR3F252_9AGAR
MEELLFTWRTGSFPGKEPFGVPAQVSIERGIWGYGTTCSRFHSSGQVTKGKVLSEIDSVRKSERCDLTPPTPSRSTMWRYFDRRLVEAGVSPGELNQILGQLCSLMRTATQPTRRRLRLSSVHVYLYRHPQPFTVPPLVLPPATPALSATPIKLEHDVSVPPTVAAPVPTAAPGFADLLSSLLKSGVVSAHGTPVGAGSTLSTVGSIRFKLAVQSLLCDGISFQCKQCCPRFFGSVTGKKELEDHLDNALRETSGKTFRPIKTSEQATAAAVSSEQRIRSMVPDTKGNGRTDRLSAQGPTQ